MIEKNRGKTLRLGLIGFGYWGPNLFRNFSNLHGVQILRIADQNEIQLKALRHSYPNVDLSADYRKLLADDNIDAIVLATPVSTHFVMAKQALSAGKHVFVEKPLATSSRHCQALIRIAKKSNKILMVGHTFEYHPAVRKIGELIKSGSFGKLRYIDAVRVNLGRYQSDGKNVLWDLAPHDLSIILHWTGKMPTEVSARGKGFVKSSVEDVVFITLEFPDGALAHIHLSWLAPAKLRKMTIVGSKKMILYDDLENFEKIKIADRSAHLDPGSQRARVNYRLGDIVSPYVEYKEPLALECAHFVECIRDCRQPLTDAANGLRVVKIIEAASLSLKQNGRTVHIT
ncbi:MAG: hypothetical protein A2036_01315 [Omnitrophica bacterium GWA2_50_21]|nr:MAG: hypothetical protein A2036_01315 [Omnitrophica bacterium GWA2_50_21]